MIEPESLVINPELVTIIGVEAAHMLESPKGSFDVKRNADFLGPFALCGLIERFAIFYAAATVHSALQYGLRRGGNWKGRIQDMRL